MKFFLLFPFLFIGMLGFTQSGDKRKEVKRHGKVILNDSIARRIQEVKDSVTKTLPLIGTDSINNDFSSNIDRLLSVNKKQREKEKRQAMIRIAIGLAFLALLIVGLRKRKK